MQKQAKSLIDAAQPHLRAVREVLRVWEELGQVDAEEGQEAQQVRKRQRPKPGNHT